MISVISALEAPTNDATVEPVSALREISQQISSNQMIGQQNLPNTRSTLARGLREISTTLVDSGVSEVTNGDVEVCPAAFFTANP